MKRTLIILGGVLLVATAVVSFVSVSNNDAQSSLLMQNVEAVASTENPECPNGCHDDGDGCHCYGDHPNDREHDWGNKN